MPAHLGGCFQVALTEGGPATAFAAFHQRNTETKCFKDFDCSDANMWLVITNECIVPKNNFAARPVAAVGAGPGSDRRDRRMPISALMERRYMFLKPVVEALTRVMR